MSIVEKHETPDSFHVSLFRAIEGLLCSYRLDVFSPAGTMWVVQLLHYLFDFAILISVYRPILTARNLNAQLM